jgi:hypothetical protein
VAWINDAISRVAADFVGIGLQLVLSTRTGHSRHSNISSSSLQSATWKLLLKSEHRIRTLFPKEAMINMDLTLLV